MLVSGRAQHRRWAGRERARGRSYRTGSGVAKPVFTRTSEHNKLLSDSKIIGKKLFVPQLFCVREPVSSGKSQKLCV